LTGVQAIHAVQGAQQGGLTATGRTNEGGNFALGNVHGDIAQALKLTVEEVQVANFDGVFSGCFIFRHE